MKYSTINIQGNLLSEEILQRVENANLDGQVVTDFGFDPKSSLKSEIEYAWSRIKLDWRNFYEKSQNLNPNDPYGTTLSRKWMEQFFETLGFDLNRTKKSLDGDNGKQYNISHIAENLDQLPIHLVGFFEPNYPEKNTLDIKTSGGTSRFSPHSLMQEYLNVTEHVYGISSNGMYLRLIRDSGRLIKLTYVEFDIKRLLEEDKYSEFTVLYRLLHSTRFPKLKSEVDQSVIEKYYQDSIETGNRIRDGLSKAVKESLLALGNGFLIHENNNVLRNKFKSGSLDAKEYYRQLLRVIYRFLFLMVTEERDLIYDNEDTNDIIQNKKSIYFKFYSIARLRKLSQIRYIYQEQFSDLWQGLVNTFQLFEDKGSGKKLGIEPLGGDLFKTISICDIHDSFLTNKLLLECVKNLNEFKDENNNLVQINYRSLDVEELGSVYEGLLELHPVIENINDENISNINFTFHEGTERKTTGSYYTRPELVNELIKSALIPVIEDRLKEYNGNKEQQALSLLKLKVCDAAAGSGHMLLAAARTISWYLARVISGEENPSPSIYRKCLRDVIQHCIYAVDYNPDAVELCKLALWLEGHNSGKPLSFLDHKIRNGNSLIGVTDLSILQKGIPDDAFNQVTDDEKKVCQELKKENSKYNKTKQASFDFNQFEKIDTTSFTGDFKELENLRQDDVESVKEVKEKFEKIRSNKAWFKDWRACNIWTAVFFWNYNAEAKYSAPSSEGLARFLNNNSVTDDYTINKADELSLKYKFFHWPLEFPDVYDQGGFDVMLGNPPWERIKLQEEEFFATKDLRISNAPNAASRKRLIASLPNTNPSLYKEYRNALHYAECFSKALRFSGRFPSSATGDINTYSIFSELLRNGINKRGRCGFIVPTGIATDDGNKEFFGNLIEGNHLVSLFDFENRKKLFQSIHSSFKFCLLTISASSIGIEKSKFGFFLTDIEQLKNPLQIFELGKEDFLRLNPNTKTCPVFRTSKDASLTASIYKRIPVFLNESENKNPWNFFIRQGLYHMTNDNNAGYIKSFNEHNFTDPVFLFEAKMMFQFDHRYSNFNGQNYTEVLEKEPFLKSIAEYVVEREDLNERIDHLNWKRKWFFIFRNITNTTNERTVIASIIPIYAPVFSCRVLFSDRTAPEISLLLGQFNSLILDYIARQKLGGTNLSDYFTKQFPVLKPENFNEPIINLIVPCILELTYTSWDIKAFADDIWIESNASLKQAITNQWEENKAITGGYEMTPPDWCDFEVNGCSLPPFKWDEERRSVIKAELDAIYAKLYGLTTEELRYILDPQDVYGPDFPGETFRVLKEKEIRLFGEFRTKRLVLEAWNKIKL